MRASRGFTLIEVLVAMIVIAIGLLGIAKMQGLAYSSTSVASTRSLAALEASSLAASMHANRAYWGAGVVNPAGVTVTGAAISDANLAVPVDCTTGGGAAATPVCVPLQLAAYDLQRWAAAVSTLLPNPVSTIQCTNVVTAPVDCTIQISWGENAVAINKQGLALAGATFNVPTYILNVEP
ncbi:MAG: type IV pilus modification protein PilV [Proteobacteria bacterium]|nr:type IV pilus modification protein PilV [Pseudomonadota bacterium]